MGKRGTLGYRDGKDRDAGVIGWERQGYWYNGMEKTGILRIKDGKDRDTGIQEYREGKDSRGTEMGVFGIQGCRPSCSIKFVPVQNMQISDGIVIYG